MSKNSIRRTPRLYQVPKVGDSVAPAGSSRFVADLKGLVGKVVGVIDGACGPIVAVQFPQHPGQTFDLYWKNLRRA
jgi:hypothetical protein